MEQRIKSVLQGNDSQALDILIPTFAVSNPRILDTTANTLKIWRESAYKPNLTVDIDPQFKPDIVADFRHLPFKNNSFDVVVFDPPYLPTSASSINSSYYYKERFGITGDNGSGSDYRTGENISDCFVPFLKEAKRVLTKPNGIVLCKIGDLVHNCKQQWQHVDFIVAAKESGMTPCDMLILQYPSAGTLISSKWKTVHHLRKSHVFWIVVRVGNKCMKG